MRRALVLAGFTLVGCGGGGSEPADIDGIDVVVSSTSVVAYVAFTGDAIHSLRFAQPGECAGLASDVIVSADSCLTEISLGGTRLATASPYGPANPFAGPGVTAATTLRVVDCGHTVEVPVRAGPYPAATDVHGTRSGSDIVVSWSAPGAASVVASVASGFSTMGCHEATATQHVFAGWGETNMLGAEARALAPPDITDSELGPIRIWYGELVDVDVP